MAAKKSTPKTVKKPAPKKAPEPEIEEAEPEIEKLKTDLGITNEPEIYRESDCVTMDDLVAAATDLTECLNLDPAIPTDLDGAEMTAALGAVEELLTMDDIIAARAFPPNTPARGRHDPRGNPVLAIETIYTLEAIGVKLPEPKVKKEKAPKASKAPKPKKEKAPKAPKAPKVSKAKLPTRLDVFNETIRRLCTGDGITAADFQLAAVKELSKWRGKVGSAVGGGMEYAVKFSLEQLVAFDVLQKVGDKYVLNGQSN